MLKEPRVISKKHLRFVASLPCCVTGLEGQSQAAHIRTGGKAGMGMKSPDDCAVPLSWMQHLQQHRTSERKFWGASLEAAKKLAKDLYAVSGDEMKGRELVRKFRMEWF